jgi:hypothetical protein
MPCSAVTGPTRLVFEFTMRYGVVRVPEKVGFASGAFKFSALWVAVDMGLLTSLVLSTLPRPT